MKTSLPALQVNHPKYSGSENGGRLHTYIQRKKDLHFNDLLDENNKRLYYVNARGMEIKGEKRAIFNKVCEQVQMSMKIVDNDLEKRRNRLRELLDKEHKEQMLELLSIIARTARVEKEKDIMEKNQQEQKRIEQSGPQCMDHETKLARLRNMSGRISLKELQKAHLHQMQERQNIQRQECERERMWHQLMLQQHQQIDARNEEHKLEMQHLKDTTKRVLSEQMKDTLINKQNQEKRVKNELNLRFKAINDTIDAEHKAALQRRLTEKVQWNEYFKRETTARDLARKCAKYPHPLDLTRIETANRDQREHEKWQCMKKHRTATQEAIFLQYETEERIRQKILEDEAENFAKKCLSQVQKKGDQERRRLEEFKTRIKQNSIAMLKQQLSERDQALRTSQLARLSAAEEARRSAQRSRQEEYEKKVEDMMKKMDYAKDLNKQIKHDLSIKLQRQ